MFPAAVLKIPRLGDFLLALLLNQVGYLLVLGDLQCRANRAWVAIPANLAGTACKRGAVAVTGDARADNLVGIFRCDCHVLHWNFVRGIRPCLDNLVGDCLGARRIVFYVGDRQLG